MFKLNKEEIGQRIQSVRKAGGWTLEEFGELVYGATKGNVNQWEKGAYIPTKQRLERIAMLGKVSINWLEYGDVQEFLEQVFPSTANEKFNTKFHKALVNKIERAKVSLDDYMMLLMYAVEVNPELAKDEEFNKRYSRPELIAKGKEKEHRHFEVEEYELFRTLYLPYLNELYKNDKDKSGSEKNNEQLLLHLFDMCSRIDDNLKLPMIELMKRISRIATENLFETDNTFLPKYATGGGYTKYFSEEQIQNRTKREIIRDYKAMKKEIVELLDEIYEMNKENNNI